MQARDRLKQLIRRSRPDIAHLHNIHYQISPSILDTLREHGLPLVMTLHDYRLVCPNGYLYTHGEICHRCKGGKFYNAIRYRCLLDSWSASLLGATGAYVHQALRLYHHVDRFIAPSRFGRDKMLEFGYEGARISHTPNFVATDYQSHRRSTEGYFVMAGYLVPQEGADIALDAIQAVPDARLYIAGTGPQWPLLQEKIRNAGLANRVSLLGFQTDSDLGSLIDRCLAVIVPSLWYENCPMTVLEAFAAGKPVVASRIRGIPEIVEEGVTGHLISPGRPELLAEALRGLLEDPSRAQEMGMKARERVIERYSPEAHLSALESLYREVLRAA